MIESHLHPALSSLPFALISVALFAELYAVYRGGRSSAALVQGNLIAGVLGILGAFLSGYLAADYGHESLGIDAEIISVHHLWGKLLLILGVVTVIAQLVSQRALFHRGLFVTTFRVLLVSLWILSMITGFLGGDMLLSAGKKIDKSDRIETLP